MSDDLFTKMFKHAETVSLEEFNDEDLLEEDIHVPEITEDQIAEEGIVKAILGGIARDNASVFREIKGWFLGIESKRKYIIMRI